MNLCTTKEMIQSQKGKTRQQSSRTCGEEEKEKQKKKNQRRKEEDADSLLRTQFEMPSCLESTMATVKKNPLARSRGPINTII